MQQGEPAPGLDGSEAVDIRRALGHVTVDHTLQDLGSLGPPAETEKGIRERETRRRGAALERVVLDRRQKLGGRQVQLPEQGQDPPPLHRGMVTPGRVRIRVARVLRRDPPERHEGALQAITPEGPGHEHAPLEHDAPRRTGRLAIPAA